MPKNCFTHFLCHFLLNTQVPVLLVSNTNYFISNLKVHIERKTVYSSNLNKFLYLNHFLSDLLLGNSNKTLL